MVRRLVRLSPPYYAAIAISIALTAIYRPFYPAGHYIELRPDLLLCSLTYTCYPLGMDLDVPVGWSLEFEVQFYLIACCLVPLVVGSARPRAGSPRRCCSRSFRSRRPTSVLRYAPPFVIGMAVVAHRRGALGLPLFAALTVAIAGGWAFLLRDPWTGATIALGALAIAVGVPMPKPLVWLGGISYSLYLLHEKLGPPFVRGIKMLGLPTLDLGWLILWSGLAIAGCIAAAWLLHRYVELPAVRWSHAIRVRSAASGEQRLAPGPREHRVDRSRGRRGASAAWPSRSHCRHLP